MAWEVEGLERTPPTLLLGGGEAGGHPSKFLGLPLPIFLKVKPPYIILLVMFSLKLSTVSFDLSTGSFKLSTGQREVNERQTSEGQRRSV